MAEHVSYWTIRRQINANVKKHIASLEESKQQIDFDESFFNENQGDLTDNLARNEHTVLDVNRDDSLNLDSFNSHQNSSLELDNAHPYAEIGTY